ncbi:hypothetical protein [Gluconobacter oxydans]|uniref:hypothetical protein n=1 Tax=Gluconobacter oxydans TaxID=442 RepID=UPI0039EC1A77
MARIRSIHPGLWTDEAFATLSMAARVLIMGIWNHADDGGGFEWKPLTLKMRIFPADNIDVAGLLEELSSSNLILEYDEDGKRYGAVRNFGKWQRAQKPDRFCPMPPEVREYAGTVHVLSKEERKKNDTATGSKDPDSTDIEDQSRTGSVPVQDQSRISRTEGRKVGREEGITSSLRSEGDASASPSQVDPVETASHPLTARPSAPDARTALFRLGLQTVRGLTGKSEAQSRSLIGKWLKACGEDASILNRILLEAADLRPAEPVAWIEAAVAKRGGRSPRDAERTRNKAAWLEGEMLEGF